jgi:hypothetical protein
MAKTARSARGEIVNFDLIHIKEQMATAPIPTTVAARENFVDQKLKRRSKRLARDIATATEQLPTEQ